MAICQKTNPYTYLGNRPLNTAPDAGLDRALYLVAFRTLSFVPVIRAVISALGSGAYLRRTKQLAHLHDVTSIDVTGHGPFPYQLDGDYLGEVEHLALRYEPDLLDLLLPEAVSANR
jgi:diacylglycerol kinase family enzyme